MEAKIENKKTFRIQKVEKAIIDDTVSSMRRYIVKTVRTLGYDQPADVTIRKTLGLTFTFKSGKNVFVRL